MERPTSATAIVIVDDHPDILILMQRMIEYLAPHQPIRTSQRADDALTQCAEQPVPLLIVDYHLPEMNGFQIAAAVKQRSPNTRIALMTAYNNAGMEQRSYEAGADFYLPKPFSLSSLEDVLRSSLSL